MAVVTSVAFKTRCDDALSEIIALVAENPSHLFAKVVRKNSRLFGMRAHVEAKATTDVGGEILYTYLKKWKVI